MCESVKLELKTKQSIYVSIHINQNIKCNQLHHLCAVYYSCVLAGINLVVYAVVK